MSTSLSQIDKVRELVERYQWDSSEPYEDATGLAIEIDALYKAERDRLRAALLAAPGADPQDPEFGIGLWARYRAWYNGSRAEALRKEGGGE